MKRLLRVVAMCGGMASASACGSSSAPVDPFLTSLQGNWTSTCASTGIASQQVTLAISGSTLTRTVLHYPNGTCASPGDVLGSQSETLILAGAVTALLGSTSVQARQVNLDGAPVAGHVLYDLFYVDAVATPARLYRGDCSAQQNCSVPDNRPTSLNTAVYYSKQ